MAENYDDDSYDLPSAPIGHLDPPAPGYTLARGGASEEDLRCGYIDLEGEIDLNDMFGAFVTPNYGLPGGACTVDDFTPEGVEDRIGFGQKPVRDLHEEQHSGTSKRSGSGGYSQKYP